MIRSCYRLMLLALFWMLPAAGVSAQLDCGVVDGVMFPVDRETSRLAQTYASASSRHQGRFHTGEDWYGGRGSSLGQPVRAAARGRITYSYELGWGRDGGVVIIEHTLPDGTIFYTQYGHMMATEQYPFPPRLSCVERGAILGVIGDARPAPHLHFEVRTANSLDPGAGYTRTDPYTQGYRNPTKFIVNLQTWLSQWHAWHLMVGSETPADERGPLSDPVVLNDNSLLFLDGAGTTLRRATPDGRVLWRIRLDVPAVAVLADRGSSLLVLQDGTFILVDVESATLGESWRVEATFSAAPLRIGNLLAFPSPTAELLLIDSSRREIVSRLPDVPSFRDAIFLPDESLALVTNDLHLLWQDRAGELRTRTHLRESASIAAFGDALLAYTRGGLWTIDRAGIWSLWREDAPASGENSGLLVTTDRVFAFTGSRLLAYDLTGQLVWETATPATRGHTRIALLQGLLFLTTQQGDLLLITQDGRFCNQAKINGNAAARQWHQLGQDGLLRLLLSDQILAIDFDLFTRPCRV